LLPVENHRVRSFRLCPSGRFRPDNDIDVLVTFASGASWRFYDLISLREKLEAMFGRPVDLVENRLVERSENYIRRTHILNHMETMYVA
jgi:predicted nucleotidyltransferase